MKVGRCTIATEHAPPGFWRWPDAAVAEIDGVEVESRAPSRFFQALDAYPATWGRLLWRIQLNKLEGTRATAPFFRTFYPGVEWNLNRPDPHWFLSGWFRWEGPGPDRPDAVTEPIRIEGDTVLFCFAREGERALYLRSRVDLRDREQIAADFHAQRDRPDSEHDPGVIRLDDLLHPPE